MAQAAITDRATELDGIVMNDGHSTLVTLANEPDIELWEKSVTPPGIDGGDAIETHTMHNVRWRTKAPRQLLSMTECTFTAAYDAKVKIKIYEQINILQEITVTHPNGDKEAQWGWLRVFEPQENTEGEQCEAEITIEFACCDEDGVEQDPIFQEA